MYAKFFQERPLLIEYRNVSSPHCLKQNLSILINYQW